MPNKIIMHFIARDKFTTGYINFFKISMPEWEHHFFVSDNGFEIKPVNNENIYYYHDYKELSESDNVKLLSNCNKIIVSSLHFPSSLLTNVFANFEQKIYVQFWGGDFYGFRFSNMPSPIHPRAILWWFRERYLRHRFIKKCAGTISLITEDIEPLLKIFPNNAKHFTAQMPGDILEYHDFDSLILSQKEETNYKILAGHSGFKHCHHIEIFRDLMHLKDYNIEIISPLSYGAGKRYSKSVIKSGHKIFGDKFKPIIDFIPKKNYVEFLASCDVAIFNNDRQAAMGNIWLLLRLGKKIYIRDNTSMFHYFKRIGACVFSVDELPNTDLKSLVYMPEEGRENNIKLAKEKFSGQSAREEWEKVLND